MAKKRNYKLNPPKSLTELNKESMLAYVADLGDEDIIWFIDVLDSNKEEKQYQFTSKNGSFKKGDTYEGYNISAVRKAFAGRYFPDLLKTKATKSKDSFTKQLEELRKKVNK